MKDPEYLKYKCTRCGKEILQNEEVLVLQPMLQTKKEPIDLCQTCKEDFQIFMKEIPHEIHR